MTMFPEVDCWCDPFGGTGTTAVAAQQRGLRYVSMDLVWEYCALQRRELVQSPLPLRAAHEPGEAGRQECL